MPKKKKLRGKKGQFMSLPHALIRHENYINCPPAGIKLLNYLFLQYNGKNNGDINCTLTQLKQFGFTKDSLLYAKRALIKHNLIQETRKNQKKICALYAFTWLPIDECKHSNGTTKLDVKPTMKSSLCLK